MKAICVRRTGGPEVLVLEDLPRPGSRAKARSSCGYTRPA